MGGHARLRYLFAASKHTRVLAQSTVLLLVFFQQGGCNGGPATPAALDAAKFAPVQYCEETWIKVDGAGRRISSYRKLSFGLESSTTHSFPPTDVEQLNNKRVDISIANDKARMCSECCRRQRHPISPSIVIPCTLTCVPCALRDDRAA